jgi:hypothetical protein
MGNISKKGHEGSETGRDSGGKRVHRLLKWRGPLKSIQMFCFGGGRNSARIPVMRFLAGANPLLPLF